MKTSGHEFTGDDFPEPCMGATGGKVAETTPCGDKVTEALATAHRVIMEQSQGCGFIKGTLWADDHTTLVEMIEHALTEARRTPAETVSREVIAELVGRFPMQGLPLCSMIHRTDMDRLYDAIYALQLHAPQPVSTGECDECHGWGFTSQSDPHKACLTCNGTGKTPVHPPVPFPAPVLTGEVEE